MKIKNIIFLLASILAFTACNDDDEPAVKNYGATVVTPPSETNFVLTYEDRNNDAFTLSWIPAEYDEIQLGNPTYLIQIDLPENNFTRAQTLFRTNETSATIGVKTLNDVITSYFLQEPEVAANFNFRIITNYGRGNGVIESSASDVFTLTLTPYAAPNLRPALHFVGNMFGAPEWDQTNYTFVMFRTDPDSETETYTGKFKVNSEFKFISDENLGSWDVAYGDGGDGVLSASGGNIKAVTEEEYYTVNANLTTMTYSVTPYDASNSTVFENISLIGINDDWDNDIQLTQSAYDPHIWYLANIIIASDTEGKFRANNDWAMSWGGTTFPYGGGSSENISITAGNYFVKFNDLTGQYIFYSLE